MNIDFSMGLTIFFVRVLHLRIIIKRTEDIGRLHDLLVTY